MSTAVAGAQSAPVRRPSRALVLLLAASTGAAVANLYYAQPLLHTIGRDFGAGSASAGLLVTLAQIGYAAGLALVVPIGDMVERRRLVAVLGLLSAAGLCASALATSIGMLIGLALLVGLGSVIAQILVPLAASLADDTTRGRVVGTVVSGLLLGILLARTVSGSLAGATSWRVVYAAAAGVTLVMAGVLFRYLPAEGSRRSLGYLPTLRSTVALFVRLPLLRTRTLLGALGFAAFSVFWTSIAYLLAGPPYHYGTTVIGLFGLVGAAGAAAASFAGRLVDGGRSPVATMAFSITIAGSFGLIALGGHHLAALIPGIMALDIGVQGLHVTNQGLIFRLSPEATSRVNASYMVGYFVGGALGSALAGFVYGAGGWPAVCILGAALGGVAIVASALRSSRPAPTATAGGGSDRQP